MTKNLLGTMPDIDDLYGHLENTTLEGKSAYEVAVANGYNGTQSEWLASLKGETGETPNLTVGTVSTGQPGTNATVTITGTKVNPVLNMTIPRGNKGEDGYTPKKNVDYFDGHTPIISSQKTDDATVIYADGIKIATLYDGLDGNTPTITATKDGKTTTIYADDEVIATINDGIDGKTPTITTSKSDLITTVYADGIEIGTISDGHSPVLTTTKDGKTLNILSDGVTIGSVLDGADAINPVITASRPEEAGQTDIYVNGAYLATINDGSDPVITSTKADGVTRIYSNGTLITTIHDGEKGDTPVITTTKANGVTTVLSDGVQVATINDGVSPTASVTKDGDVSTLTVTDVNGTTTVQIEDGSGMSAIDPNEDGNVTLINTISSDDVQFDSTPTENSLNVVTSGGIYDVIADINSNIAAPYYYDKGYKAGEFCLQDGQLYLSDEDIDPEHSWEDVKDHWDAISVGETLGYIIQHWARSIAIDENIDPDKNYSEGDYGMADGMLGKYKYDSEAQELTWYPIPLMGEVRKALNNIANPIDRSKNDYAIGDYCLDDDRFYKYEYKGHGDYDWGDTTVARELNIINDNIAGRVNMDYIDNLENHYNVGDYILYNGYLRVFDGSRFVKTTAMDEITRLDRNMASLHNPEDEEYYQEGQYCSKDGYFSVYVMNDNQGEVSFDWVSRNVGDELYRIKQYLAPRYNPNDTYQKGQCCLYQDRLAVYGTIETGGTTINQWFPTTIIDELNKVKNNLNNYVQNTNYATSVDAGIVKVQNNKGLQMLTGANEGQIAIKAATVSDIKSGSSAYYPITPQTIDEAVFYGLAKAAGDSTQVASSNSIGRYTDDAIQKIQRMIYVPSPKDIANDIAVYERNYYPGDYLYRIFEDGLGLYKCVEYNVWGNQGYENCWIKTNIANELTDIKEIIAPRYNSSETYSVGQCCFYNDILSRYTAFTDTDTGSFSFEWVPTTVIEELSIIKSAIENNVDYMAFFGLGKAAGLDDDSEIGGVSSNKYAYTEEAKTAIQAMLDVPSNSDLIGYVKTSDYATNSTAGIVKVSSTYGIGMTNNTLYAVGASTSQVKTGTESYKMINPNHQHESAFYGLAKAAGDTTQSQSDNAVGTYTDEAKSAIKTMLDITDVGIEVTDPNNDGILVFEELGNLSNAGVIADIYSNIATYEVGDYCIYEKRLYKCTTAISTAEEWNSSHWMVVNVGDELVDVKSNYVKNTDYASVGKAGVVQVHGNNGININGNHNLQIIKAETALIKEGTNNFKPIVPANQHESVFYGLAKVSGDTTQSASDNAVGTYTDGAKTAIRLMIGAVGDVQVNGTSVISNGVADIPAATANNYGVVLMGNGLQISSSNGTLMTRPAGSSQIKAGSESFMQITPNVQHQSAFYGLAKAAGDTTQASSSNAVGTYTDEAKTAIRTMLSAVGNTDYASSSAAGIVKVTGNDGIIVDANGVISSNVASSSQIKNGTNSRASIVTSKQHESVFYGLAKSAGDTTQSSSSNAVGTYTDSAKDAIKSMLGIDLASGNIQNVSGTTVTITGEPNARYICGEVATIDITPPATGTIIVRFTSGSTATVLTLPSTVKMPEWFDALSLEADTIYELSITDGVYGAVMSWAV